MGFFPGGGFVAQTYFSVGLGFLAGFRVQKPPTRVPRPSPGPDAGLPGALVPGPPLFSHQGGGVSGGGNNKKKNPRKNLGGRGARVLFFRFVPPPPNNYPGGFRFLTPLSNRCPGMASNWGIFFFGNKKKIFPVLLPLGKPFSFSMLRGGPVGGVAGKPKGGGGGQIFVPPGA